MAFIFKHSAIGTLIHYFSTGTISFSRQNIKHLSIAFSSAEDLSSSTDVENAGKEGKEAERDKNVGWDGSGAFFVSMQNLLTAR